MNSTMASYRELPILYNTYDETVSWLSSENKAWLDPANTASSSETNTQGLPSGNSTVWGPQLVNFGDSRKFGAAPTFYSINGFVYANTPTFEMCLNDNVSSDVPTFPRCRDLIDHQVIWGFNIYGQASHVYVQILYHSSKVERRN
jgi:hypothetical protein